MALSSPTFSGSAGGGRPVKIAATSTPGTTIHDTGTSSTIQDEIWAWAFNTDTTDRKLTVEFGGTTSPDDTIEMTIPAESGLVPILVGNRLSGTGGAARSVKAFAATANVIGVIANINRGLSTT